MELLYTKFFFESNTRIWAEPYMRQQGERKSYIFPSDFSFTTSFFTTRLAREDEGNCLQGGENFSMIWKDGA
jgi:hypothetical protein